MPAGDSFFLLGAKTQVFYLIAPRVFTRQLLFKAFHEERKKKQCCLRKKRALILMNTMNPTNTSASGGEYAKDIAFDQQQQKDERSSAQGDKKQDEQVMEVSRKISDLLSRLRLLEERYGNLRREHQMTSQNMIEHHQQLSKQQRKLSDQLLEAKRTIKELSDQIGIMKGELTDSAKSHQVLALERYIDLWQPLDFITRDQAQRMIAEKSRMLMQEKKSLDKKG